MYWTFYANCKYKEKMKIYQAFTLSLCLFCAQAASTGRHMIYWNPFMNPSLVSDEGYVLNVKIGEFLDILCPQTSLMSITNGPSEPERFNIFNVTRTDFDQCRREDRSNFIFACDRPDRENKLTIKFQVISPSPLGFRFHYCQDYYFVAFPRDKTKESAGCRGDGSTRLHIKVACKDRPPATTTTTVSTTTTVKTTTTTPSKIDPDSDEDEEIIRPGLINPHSPSRNQTRISPTPAIRPQVGGDPNSVGRHQASFYFITMAYFLMFLLTSVLSYR